MAFLSSAIFGELPVYVGQAVPFFHCEKDITYCVELAMCFYALIEMQKENKGVETFFLRKKPLTP